MVTAPHHFGIRRALAVAAIVSVVSSPVSRMHAAQDATTGTYWNMTYHAGAAPIRPESKIDVSIEDQKLLLRVKKGPEFAIPLDQITAVSSNVTGHYGRVSLAEGKFVDSEASRCGPGPDVVCAAVVLTAFLLIVPSYPIKTTDRLVQIVWRDKNADEEVVLKLHKNDFNPFLAQLEKGTAKPWKNLDTEWVKVQQELKGAESSKIPIRLERKVRIAKSDLEPGSYQIILLQRDANRGELYFFPGDDINIQRLAAVATVEITLLAGGDEKLQVDYKQDASGKTTISSVHTSSKVLRFP